MLNQDLFCDGLLNNLVKTREVENITNATKLVVNFRSLGSVLCSVRSIIDFSRNLQEVSLNSTDQRYLADLWINELQKFSKQKTKVIPLTRGLKTTRSIPRRPKSEIFAGIPFTWGKKFQRLLPIIVILHLELDDQVAGKDNVHVHDHLLPADVLAVHLDSRDPWWDLVKKFLMVLPLSGKGYFFLFLLNANYLSKEHTVSGELERVKLVFPENENCIY